jgi:hypothetical protein
MQQSNIKLYGRFDLKVHEKGELVYRYQKKNQITNEARLALLQLLQPVDSPTLQTDNAIWSFEIGVNPAPTSILDTASTVNTAWREVFNPGECVVVNNPPNDFMLSITKVVPEEAAVGMEICEAGIFTRGDNDDPALSSGRKLYARQRFSPTIKTMVMSLTIEWQLGIILE